MRNPPPQSKLGVDQIKIKPFNNNSLDLTLGNEFNFYSGSVV